MSPESELLDDLAKLSSDPLAFVMWAFPWGEVNTELEHATGPENWQREILTMVRDGLPVHEAIRIAVASGHGVGKSALVSWLILWSISTYEDTRGVITANTETQLKTKTWAELGKWHRLFIGSQFFKLTATAIFSADAAHERTWRIDLIPWSERNAEAFAGLHNKGKRILVIFDEASGIDDVIWETTQGALTDSNTQIIWLVCGNPTKNTGRFKECFPGGKYSNRWLTKSVDGREVSLTNKEEIRKWIADEGEDSDYVRIRVKGEFPRRGSIQFISTELVSEAAGRDFSIHPHDPLVIGVDVARFGDDASVIYIRKGRDGRSIPPVQLRGVDTMTLAGRVAELQLEYRADAIFVDGGGVGGGVVDRLRQLQVPVWDIQFGSKSDRVNVDDRSLYANKRAEIWGYMREWLKGGAISDDPNLKAQLSAPEYGFNARNEIQLERKEDMKRRGVASPDLADALALTFSYPVMPSAAAGREGADRFPLVQTEYDPMELARVA